MSETPGPRSRELFERARQLMPGGVSSPVRAFQAVGGDPVVIAYGRGPHVVDADGRRYIDYVCAYGPLILGHAPPRIAGIVAAAAQRGTAYGATTLSLPDSAGVPASYAAETLLAPYNDIEAVRALFEAEGERIAAVILEPIAANMGVVPPAPGFLEGLREVTTQHGALLIFDEVISGFRLHYGAAQTLLNVTPDITCLGKIIGGGLPVGAYGGRRDIMEQVAPLGPVYQAGTLSGNPLAMAAGIVTLEMLRPEVVYQRLEITSVYLEDTLRRAAAAAEVPVRLNRVGSIMTMFFTAEDVTDYGAALKSDRDRYADYFRDMLRRGVFLAPSQFEAMFVSTEHGDDEVVATGEAVEASLRGLNCA